jgi:hypothetical protein
MWQQGQVVKLKAKALDGQPLWAYRYRVDGRGSARPQVGGFASRAEAQRALTKVLGRLGPSGRATTMTLGELVKKYLEMHQAEPVTIAKLRWLLRKATVALGDVRLAELAPKEVYAWWWTVPDGHRYEATQALRQVLSRAVAWGLIDYNPAKRGVPNPMRRAKEKRPFESWDQVRALAKCLGTRRTHRLSHLRPPALETRSNRGRNRTTPPPVRHAPHLRHVRASSRGVGVRGLAVHGLEHRNDRPPLRPPRPREPRARGLATRRARNRTSGGRRRRDAQNPLASAIHGRSRGDRGGWWTLRGRRGRHSSYTRRTKTANQQELREALYRTRTDDPLLTILGNWSQPRATVLGLFFRLPVDRICH